MATKKRSKATATLGADYYRGTVSGIDVMALGGQPVKCFAFITQAPTLEIQVVTYESRLQAALELASAKKVEVEVKFIDDGVLKSLTRVRLLDR